MGKAWTNQFGFVGSNALDWYEEEQEQNGEGGKAFRGASLQKR